MEKYGTYGKMIKRSQKALRKAEEYVHTPEISRSYIEISKRWQYLADQYAHGPKLTV